MSETSQLVVVPELENSQILAALEPSNAVTLKQAYAPFFVEFKALEERAKDIAVNAPQAARKMRLELRAVRIAAEKTRKSAGENAQKYKVAVDSIYKLLENRLSPVEDRMENIENQEKIAEAERQAKLKEARIAEFTPFGDPQYYDLATMPELQYQQLLAQTKATKAALEDATRKAEADRKAKEEADIAERKRLAEENAKLVAQAEVERKAREALEKKAADERAALAAQVAKERKAFEDEAMKAKMAREAVAKKEADERAAQAAKEKAIQDAANAKAAADRKALEDKAKALEAQIKAAADAKAKAEADAKALELAKAKQAAATPDKEKLEALAKAIRSLNIPNLVTPAGKELRTKIVNQTEKFAIWVQGEATKL